MSLNTSAPSYTAGQVVTATQLNALQDGIQAAWTSYTPTLTNITLGNGSVSAAYLQIGKTIMVRFAFNAGSTTTYSAGNLGVSLPVTPHNFYTSGLAPNNVAAGACVVNPTGTRLSATCVITSGGILNFITDSATSSTPVTNTNPGAWGTSALMGFTVTYEAA